MAPFRLPPWLTATAVSLATFRKGMTPWLSPSVPLIGAPVPRMFVQSLPNPPAHFDSFASSEITLKMCSRSSITVER